MFKDLNPGKALIFRITHRSNIARILEKGCPCRSQAVGSKGFVDIGNVELIEKRASRPVPCGPGGTLSDYVPFYFTPYTPMLYNIKTGYNVPKRPVEEILIMVSSLHHLRKMGLPFVFTDRHAYLKMALFSDDLDDLDRIIWSTLQARDFRRDDLEKFEKYQAEALVHKLVPVDALLGIVCYNEATRNSVQAEADGCGWRARIVAQPQWYV